MTDAPTPRPQWGPRFWGPRVQPDPSVAFNPHRLTLAALTYPAWKHCLIAAFRSGCLALLGHPGLALAWFIVSCLTDIAFQAIIGVWSREARESRNVEAPVRVAVLCAFRSALYVAGPLVATLQGGRPEDFLFLTLLSGSTIAFSLSYGAFSKKVFWGMALPPLLGFSLVAVALLAPVQAAVILASVAFTAVVMMMVWTTWRDAMAEWRRTHDASLKMIRALEAARDRALAERVAADEAREVARRAGQAKADFLAMMSHQIRTPMNGVLGMAEMLRVTATGEEQKTRLRMLTDSGEHLLAILDDILDMSKVDAGRLGLTFEREDLPRFLEQLVAFWQPEAAAKGLTLRLEADPRLPRFVSMDAVRLRQVLFNLLGNAIRFTEVGSVTVTAQAGAPIDGRVRLRLAVRDTGPGVPAEVLPRLFEPFAGIGEVATRRFDGAGLGLAICKQMTELMGGRIRAESTPGDGATFHIELVLETARAARAARRDDADDELPPLKVLAVDDNAVNLDVVEQMLALRGHAVVKAASGAEGLRMASEQIFDLVLMDIHMPEMDGIEVLKTLRAHPGLNQTTPVVALTADVTSGGPDRYIALGFNDCTTKPLQSRRLYEVIARSLAMPAVGEPA
jgi:signal transduction histidine kinase/CheY-like chemotaxis protein